MRCGVWPGALQATVPAAAAVAAVQDLRPVGAVNCWHPIEPAQCACLAVLGAKPFTASPSPFMRWASARP